MTLKQSASEQPAFTLKEQPAFTLKSTVFVVSMVTLTAEGGAYNITALVV
jgi:hypothetical protein